jgi:hypothetical protein
MGENVARHDGQNETCMVEKSIARRAAEPGTATADLHISHAQ